ncbi:MAG: hypothetical protein QXO25_03635 [Candidatus Bathyarchaeia archaeon]
MEAVQIGKDMRLVGSVWHNPVDRKIYQGRAGERYRGQVVSDVSTIQAQVVLEEVLGLARPLYKLRQACRVINIPQLTLSVDIATKISAQEQVPPLVEADIKAQTYTRVNFDLWKNVTHVVLEDEVQKRAAHDVLRLHVEDAAKALAQAENSQIYDVMKTATAVTGESWNAMTTPPDNDYDPFNKIGEAIEAIEAEGYEPDFMAVPPRAWNAFIRNSYVRELVKAGIVSVGAGGASFTLPGWPGIKVIVDTGMTEATATNSVAVIGDSTAPGIALGNGPTESARYRNEPCGYDAFIIRQWLEPKLIVGNAIRKLTGIIT